MSTYKRKPPAQMNVPPPPGAKPPAYARFIPREELNSFAAWNPDALSDGVKPSPLRRATDQPPPPDAPDGAEVLAAQLRAARQSGYQDGYRDGLVALDAFKQNHARQVAAQIGALTTAYQDELSALQQQLAQAVMVAATQLARQVVRSELRIHPELIAKVAQEAVETLLASARHISLRVHPDDHALVSLGVGEALAARGVRLRVDAGLTRGGCAVECDIGAVDATLQMRWERAAAALGCESGWEVSASEAGADPCPAECDA